MIKRVNYFLLHIWLNTNIGTNLEMYLQLEIGPFSPFLITSYEIYMDLTI